MAKRTGQSDVSVFLDHMESDGRRRKSCLAALRKRRQQVERGELDVPMEEIDALERVLEQDALDYGCISSCGDNCDHGHMVLAIGGNGHLVSVSSRIKDTYLLIFHCGHEAPPRTTHKRAFHAHDDAGLKPMLDAMAREIIDWLTPE